MVKYSQSQTLNGDGFMGISDVIACFINDILESEQGCAELKRAELAQRFKCVPSQINYVISTRFSPEHGYIVESRRGGGGYIRISRVQLGCRQLLMHAVNAVGDEIDPNTARAFLSNLLAAEAVDEKSVHLMSAALGDNTLRCLPPKYRDMARACIFKQMLLNFVRE